MRISVPRRIRSSLCGGHQGRKVNFFFNNTYVVCTNYLCAWKTLDFLSLLSLLKLDKCSVVVVRREDREMMRTPLNSVGEAKKLQCHKQF